MTRSVGSIDKKRARDRRAQQNLRARRLNRTDALQEQVAALEEKCRGYEAEAEALRRESEVLRGRQDRIRQLVGEDADVPPTATVTTVAGLEESGSPPPNETTILSPVVNFSPHPSPWRAARVGTFLSEQFNECFARPDLVCASPSDPEPAELLYGSTTNFLANMIHDAIRFWGPCRDPERLASGMMAYSAVKWLVQPDQAGLFARLCEFQKPVPEQLAHPHPPAIDLVPWPKLRANMISRHGRCEYGDLSKVLALFFCCLKVRWPWADNFLEPERGTNRLRVRREFYDVVTRIDGWGLTDDFARRYPELMEGLDMDSVRYQFG